MDISKQLVRRFADGDTNAFRQVFRAAVGDVYRLALRMLRSPEAAEDVVQETFLRLYRMRHQVDPEKSLAALVLRIATNLTLDALRRSRRVHPVADLEDSGLAAGGPNGVTGSTEIVQLNRIDLERALDRLPALYQMTLVLKYAHDLSYQEIAEALDITVPAVALRIKRGKELLRRRLTDTTAD